MYLFLPISYFLSTGCLSAGHLQLAVRPVGAFADLVQDVLFELFDLLRFPFLDSEERSQAYVHKTLVKAQVEPSADVNVVGVFGATIDKHVEDFLLDIHKTRVC